MDMEMKKSIFNLMLLASLALFVQACGGSDSTKAKDPKEKDPVEIVDKSDQTILDNGVWRQATPASVNLDPNALNQAFDYAMADGTFSQAALVVKDGKLVYEKYRGIGDNELTAISTVIPTLSLFIKPFYGARDKNSLATSWSMAKSFTSALVSIAVEQDYLVSIDEKASDYISEWANDDRSHITIRDLLNMRSGLKLVCLEGSDLAYCDPSADIATDNYIVLAPNQVQVCIDRPMSSANAQNNESKQFIYANCDTMILGEILHQATGKDIQTFADINLFSKIGITAYWWRDNSNAQVGGNRLSYCCLDATPRDFAKFGQLLLNNGLWDGQQVIPASYIDEIKKSATRVSGSEQYTNYYGLQFWSFIDSNRPDSVIYYAQGLDGQFIMIDFDNKIVAVRNSLYYQKEKLPPVSDKRKIAIEANIANGLSVESINLVSSSAPLSLPLSFLVDGGETGFDEFNFFDKIIKSIK